MSKIGFLTYFIALFCRCETYLIYIFLTIIFQLFDIYLTSLQDLNQTVTFKLQKSQVLSSR